MNPPSVFRTLKSTGKHIATSVIHHPLRLWWRRRLSSRSGDLRRLTPISRVFGIDRGKPIDRCYIEAFLSAHSSDIRGRVLEIGDRGYTVKFGGKHVACSEVLHVKPGNPQATLIGDLESGQGIPQASFDCMILTQTFPFIYDVSAAVANCYAALKPDGVLLVTCPGISQISRYDMDRWGDYWRFTSLSARRLLETVFVEENMTVRTYGNVLVACAFLQGLAAEELTSEELDYHDPDYEVLITVRAVKPAEKMP